ncbi:MAG: nicotinate (nicotinamide) nucleotide adenylyltransferase [Reinekea sp.]
MSPKQKVMVVYGGTFDPFHRGHEAICHAILQYSFVQQLRLIPCHIPPLKDEATASSEQRLDMLRLWQDGQARSVVVDDIELQRDGPSYTMDTLGILLNQNPGTQIILAMGADAWQSLPQWHGYSELQQWVNIWVFDRQGSQLPPLQGWTRVTGCKQLIDISSGHYFVDQRVRMDVSSTVLRDGTESLRAHVPEAIFRYIQENNLYLEMHQSL